MYSRRKTGGCSDCRQSAKSLAEFAPAGANEMRFILGRNSFLPQNTAIAAASSEPGMVRSAAGTALLRDSGLSSFFKPKQPLRFEEEKQSSVCKLSRLPRKPRKQSPRDLRRRRRAAAMSSFSTRSPAERVRVEACRQTQFCHREEQSDVAIRSLVPLVMLK